ncbi:unnamed protein product [Rotaria sordida]|uniref:Uncharacterized protein n=1 Tax=Rotaria sordida TaxID=392033 RepID=A0A820DSL2_9BILA|nr:unnamed protein product [Rotaria sordida]
MNIFFLLQVSGNAARFNLIVLIFNIGLLIGTICLITFIFDIIGLHIYCHSAVDRPQKFQDVVEESKRNNEQVQLTE